MTATKVRQGTDSSLRLEGMSQVVLYNDDVNTFEHVTKTLMQVFEHSHSMAVKIAREAHESGRTVAQVEEHGEAIQHKQQLVSAGLTAEVEKI